MKKNALSDDDINLFRAAMRGIKRMAPEKERAPKPAHSKKRSNPKNQP